MVRLPRSCAIQINSQVGRLQFIGFYIPPPPPPKPPDVFVDWDLRIALEKDRVYQVYFQLFQELASKPGADESEDMLRDLMMERRREVFEQMQPEPKAGPLLYASHTGKSAPAFLLTRSSHRVFGIRSNALGITCETPHWFPMFVAGLLGALYAPTFRFQFSLGTLLIAMTVVAVALGMIVWMSRAG